jgi:hypothetical protein
MPAYIHTHTCQIDLRADCTAYILTYVFACIHIYIHTYTYNHDIPTCSHDVRTLYHYIPMNFACIHTYIHAYIHICTYNDDVLTCIHDVCTICHCTSANDLEMYVHTCTYSYIHTYVHIHTYTYTGRIAYMDRDTLASLWQRFRA